MKKVIDGLRYNTETAEEIHRWDNGLDTGDFKSCEETLYLTAKGRYFLHGQGGAMSKYSVPVSGGRGGGEEIVPMSADEVREWLEEHDGIDALEKYFSDDIEEA